jgi:hypothetical protein
MSHKELIAALVARIRLGITKSGICNINEADLPLIWVEDAGPLSDLQKRIRVHDFSLQYGFLSVIDYSLASAVFRNLN